MNLKSSIMKSWMIIIYMGLISLSFAPDKPDAYEVIAMVNDPNYEPTTATTWLYINPSKKDSKKIRPYLDCVKHLPAGSNYLYEARFYYISNNIYPMRNITLMIVCHVKNKKVFKKVVHNIFLCSPLKKCLYLKLYGYIDVYLHHHINYIALLICYK